jgi:hypothetical protein
MSVEEKPKKGKEKKSKGKKGKASPSVDAGAISVASHPRASDAVSTLKAWGGLIGFGLTAFLSLRAGVPLAQVGMRAIIAGIAGYLVAWACAVAAWRAIVAAEARARIEHRATASAESAKPGNGKR